MRCRSLLIACLLWPVTALADDLPVVEQVDLSRYTGTWYEIARLPHFFQRGCINSRAEYRLNQDGTVAVINRCEQADEPPKRAEGVARVVDTDTNARLKVRFLNWFSRLFPWLTEGDYWIIYLDADYQHAIVGEPSREYLWLLSRTPAVNDTQRDLLVEFARDRGFPVEQLVFNRDLAAATGSGAH